LVTNDLVAKRHDLVYTALWPLVPEEQVPMDIGHAGTSMAGRAGFGQHVDKARQDLIPRVDTPSVRTGAVADANFLQTLVSNDRDPIDHLDRANVRVVQATRPKEAQHLRVGGRIFIGSFTGDGVSHVRLAVCVAAVHRHRGGVDYAGIPGC